MQNQWSMKIILTMKKMRNIKKLLVLVKKHIHLKFLCLKYYLRKKCIANCIAFSKMPVLKIEQTQVFQGIWKNLVRFRPSAPIKNLPSWEVFYWFVLSENEAAPCRFEPQFAGRRSMPVRLA